ncbi:MAG: PEGA domain-containing protein [Planctomycetota bacterium]|nr:PEGA domain-containing protein [Planctomycetota bacterium]
MSTANIQTGVRPGTAGAVLFAAAVLLVTVGCVERKLTIKSDPTGGTVWLDGVDVGEAPVTVPFTYYGTREVVVEKELHRPVRLLVPIGAPAYQIFPLDFFTEVILPTKIVDHRIITVGLEPLTPTPKAEVLQRAAELKKEAEKVPE